MSTTFYTDPKYVTLLSTMALDGKPMGDIFGRLVTNDLYIASNFTNIIGVWECKWYYDKNERGYQLGHLCWLNTEDPVAFVKKNYDLIQEYTDLRSIIVNKLPDFDPTSDEITAAYYSAMTGYTDPSIGIVKPLEPIFDIGDYSKNPQLVVSLKDDNKEPASDPTAWKKLFIEDEEGVEAIDSIVASFLKDILSAHLVEYHLSGKEAEVLSTLSNYLDEFDEKQHITSLSNFFYVDFNSRHPKTSGVDYVLDYVRKPYQLSGAVSEYQAVRYWRSGLIEHFGTISKENTLFRLSNYFVIPFDWKYTGTGGTKAYAHGGISEHLKGLLSVLETDDNQVSPIDSFINATYAIDEYKISGSSSAIPFANSDYSIAISPVFQNLTGIVEDFIEPKYGSDALDTKWNNNYLIDSVDAKMKTGRYCVVNLADSRIVAPYISYYAIGKGGRRT